MEVLSAQIYVDVKVAKMGKMMVQIALANILILKVLILSIKKTIIKGMLCQ